MNFVRYLFRPCQGSPAGADTQVVAHISLRDLRAMPGASGLEDVWIRSVLGESGYLTGKDAEAAACDAMIVPVVAGAMDGTVLDQMVELVLGAFGHRRPDDDGPDPGGADRLPASTGSTAASSSEVTRSRTARSLS